MSRLEEGFNNQDLVQITNFNFKFNSASSLSTESSDNLNCIDNETDPCKNNKKIKLSN